MKGLGLRRPACVFALCVVSLGVAADPAAERRLERERIGREQAAAELQFKARRAECERQFVVTACVDRARAERRTELEHLRHQQVLLGEAERKERAAARLQLIEEKQRAAAARPPPAAASQASRAARTPPPGKGKEIEHDPPAAGSTAAEDARAAERAAARQQREADAARHRATVEQRNAERAAGHKPAAPLPVPAASALPR